MYAYACGCVPVGVCLWVCACGCVVWKHFPTTSLSLTFLTTISTSTTSTQCAHRATAPPPSEQRAHEAHAPQNKHAPHAPQNKHTQNQVFSIGGTQWKAQCRKESQPSDVLMVPRWFPRGSSTDTRPRAVTALGRVGSKMHVERDGNAVRGGLLCVCVYVYCCLCVCILLLVCFYLVCMLYTVHTYLLYTPHIPLQQVTRQKHSTHPHGNPPPLL